MLQICDFNFNTMISHLSWWNFNMVALREPSYDICGGGGGGGWGKIGLASLQKNGKEKGNS
jgi:hypothetical protein